MHHARVQFPQHVHVQLQHIKDKDVIMMWTYEILCYNCTIKEFPKPLCETGPCCLTHVKTTEI